MLKGKQWSPALRVNEWREEWGLWAQKGGPPGLGRLPVGH